MSASRKTTLPAGEAIPVLGQGTAGIGEHSGSSRDEIAALKRTRILAAAADLFYENGYENTTLDAVAERLGVSKPFIYAHFNSKADLLADICSRGIASSLEALDQALSTDASPGMVAELFLSSPEYYEGAQQ